MRVRIASYNIRKGGRPRQALLGEVLQSLEADVTILQEATDPAVVATLAEATGSSVLLAEAGRSVAVLGRLDGLTARWHRPTARRSFAEVGLGGTGIRILGVHLTAGLSARGERRRLRELDAVLGVAAAGPGPGRTVIAGDLNSVAPGDAPSVAALPAWIRLLLHFDGGIQTAVIGRVLADGFADAHRRLNPSDAGATLPAAAPSVRLDYLFVGRDLVADLAACATGAPDRALAAVASDHLPVILDVEMPSSG